MEKISIDEEEIRAKEIDREYAQWKMETLSAQVEILANQSHGNLPIDLIYGKCN